MKPAPRLRSCLLAMLDVVEDMVFLANRPSLGQISRYWGYAETRAAYRNLWRWESQNYLERVGNGCEASYRITETGKKLLERRRPSPRLRHRPWDGLWRMVIFDVPETSRKGRDMLRKLLQTQRLGCLQKSVWISPDPILSRWQRLIEQANLAPWVLLVEGAKFSSVDHLEIARRVWALDEVDADYQKHIAEFEGLPRRLRKAQWSTLDGELRQAIRREGESYFDNLQEDPMLPSMLLPPKFAGFRADALHGEIRQVLRGNVFRERS